LRINYRTSHQIRAQADKLLGEEIADVDGNGEKRDAISVFNGPVPTIRILGDETAEIDAVAAWLRERLDEGMNPGELALFVRSPEQMPRAEAAAKASGALYKVLDERVQAISDRASLSTMHLAKGLEFRAVAVMACDDEVVPLQSRIEQVSDAGDLEEVYNTERHLLYVACTRARDHLLVTAVSPGSEFLTDLR
jgi:superfamily I DNA/RNA helicase